MIEKTLMKSASKTKTGLLKGTSIHQNVYSDKSFIVMNENRGPVMITAQKIQKVARKIVPIGNGGSIMPSIPTSNSSAQLEPLIEEATFPMSE